MDGELEWDEEIVFDQSNIDSQVLTVRVDLAAKACATTPFAANTSATQCECNMGLMCWTLPKVCAKASLLKATEEFLGVLGNEDASERPAECKGRALRMPWDPGVVYQKDIGILTIDKKPYQKIFSCVVDSDRLENSGSKINDKSATSEVILNEDKCPVERTRAMISTPVEPPIFQLTRLCGAFEAIKFNEDFEDVVNDGLDGDRFQPYTQSSMLANGRTIVPTTEESGLLRLVFQFLTGKRYS